MALIVCDLRRLLLPDALCVALGLAGLGFHWTTHWTFVSASDALAGAVLGGSLLLGVRLFYRHVCQREALGLGDVKLMLAAGLWVGAWNVPLLLAVASGGTVLTLAALRLLRTPSSPFRHGPVIPFGPGLCVALLLVSAMQALGS